MVLFVIAALGPGKWTPRTALGWQFDHFIGYFGITLFFCFAWARPFVVVGGVVMALAAVPEALQVFTPDRSAYLQAAFYGAGGALAAALIAEFVIRLWRLPRRDGGDGPSSTGACGLNAGRTPPRFVNRWSSLQFEPLQGDFRKIAPSERPLGRMNVQASSERRVLFNHFHPPKCTAFYFSERCLFHLVALLNVLEPRPVRAIV
jgi:hypothetical protein